MKKLTVFILVLFFISSCTKTVYIRERYPEIKKPSFGEIYIISNDDLDILSDDAQKRILHNFATMSAYIIRLELSISIYNNMAKEHNESIKPKLEDKLTMKDLIGDE